MSSPPPPPPSVPPLPTLHHFLRVSPVEHTPPPALQSKLLDRTGRAIARAVHEGGAGVPADVIAHVCCVPQPVVRRALDNAMGDLLCHDKWIVPPNLSCGT
ncbi:hypothetical protein C8R43DRAFT_1231794 [Mycena crocata]|nr:hypothetical protein C8R43DRAFT_1231794 [Mycena crocata]